MRVLIRPYLFMYTSFFEQPEVPGSEHSVLIDVFRQRDALAAQIAIAKHIRTGASNLIYFLMNNQAPPCVLVDSAASGASQG